MMLRQASSTATYVSLSPRSEVTGIDVLRSITAPNPALKTDASPAALGTIREAPVTLVRSAS
jgi:hypothetical protein